MKPLDLPDIEISLPGDAPEVEAILVMMERGRVFRFAPVSVSTDETGLCQDHSPASWNKRIMILAITGGRFDKDGKELTPPADHVEAGLRRGIEVWKAGMGRFEKISSGGTHT